MRGDMLMINLLIDFKAKFQAIKNRAETCGYKTTLPEEAFIEMENSLKAEAKTKPSYNPLGNIED